MQDMHQVFVIWESLAGFVAVILVLSFVVAFLYGLEARRARVASGKESEHYFTMRERHFLFVGIFLFTLVVAIGVIEHMAGLARDAGYATPRDWQHMVHYIFDFIFFVCLGFVLLYNGYRSTRHGVYVRKLVAPSIVVLVTGGYLYVQFCLTH